MSAAAEVMSELKVAHELRVPSAHRTPDLTLEYAANAAARGLRAIIAGAGGAAHLAGVVAAKTLLPVIGVPMPTTSLNGMDSLLSIVRCRKGCRSRRWQLESRARPMRACSRQRLSHSAMPN